jgi:hypothetical protein
MGTSVTREAGFAGTRRAPITSGGMLISVMKAPMPSSAHASVWQDASLVSEGSGPTLPSALQRFEPRPWKKPTYMKPAPTTVPVTPTANKGTERIRVGLGCTFAGDAGAEAEGATEVESSADAGLQMSSKAVIAATRTPRMGYVNLAVCNMMIVRDMCFHGLQASRRRSSALIVGIRKSRSESHPSCSDADERH